MPHLLSVLPLLATQPRYYDGPGLGDLVITIMLVYGFACGVRSWFTRRGKSSREEDE